jgi:hypothetical protein
MVVIIDDCAGCGHRVSQYGAIVICDYPGHATARHVHEAAGGPICVIDCPAADPAEVWR